jgi:hypothetical protein
MAQLLEVDYEKIFSPKTMALLKNKSGESLKQMLGDKNLRTVMKRSTELLPKIIEAEEGYRDELEMIATQIVTEAYPIIDYANIKIDAKIVKMGEIDVPMGGNDNEEDPLSLQSNEELKAKRRIINGISQGASIRGAFAFLIFREHLDDISPELIDKYNEILKLAFGIYDNEEAIAMLLAMLAQQKKIEGGESDMEYNEEDEQFVIKARALCFPMLVHEIVKGLYEILGSQGFTTIQGPEAQDVITKVDVLTSEPRDLQYGKFIYDALNKLYIESNIDDARVRELFFTEVYKLEDNEFIPFIENAINNKLTPDQKKWATDAMKDIASDLSKDDLPFNV